MSGPGLLPAWTPLATLVRLPVLRELRCPAEAGRPCRLLGENLFLLDAISSDPAFRDAVRIADGFTEQSAATPRPRAGGRLYVRLHDDPGVVGELAF